MSQDWFRKTRWTKSDEEDFFAQLKRARRYNRSQYLRVQAWHLAETRRPELIRSALGLLEVLIQDYPDRLQLASAYLQKAEALAQLSFVEKAVTFFKKAIGFEREFPNVCTSAPVTFGLFVVEHKLTHEYREVLAVLDEFEKSNSSFPVQRFEIWSVRSLIAEETGEAACATLFAKRALTEAAAKHSGFWKHPNLGLVGETKKSLFERVKSIAGSNLNGDASN